MLANQRTYELECNSYDASIRFLTEKEIEQIKKQIKNELPCFENKTELLYFIAVDWSITISVVKHIMSL